MSVEHAFSCPSGGFPSIRHNELHDIAAAFLSDICHNISIEPTLQLLSGEHFQYRSANVEDGARLDVSAESFWGRDRRLAYFDIKVFNPLASNYASSPLGQCYCRAELDIKENMMKESMRLRGELFLLWFFPLLVAWVPQLHLFTNELPLWFLRRGVIPTTMCCIGLDVVFVFHCSVLQLCVCGDQDLLITNII